MMRALAAAEARHRDRHPRSLERHLYAARHMPGGHTRSALYYAPFPLTFAGGRGNRLTDVDGLEYLDLLGDYSAGLYGHSNPVIQAAAKRAIDDGLSLGGPNVYEARLAEAIRSRFTSMDLVRFVNSGTEANLMALAAVRARDPSRTGIMVFGNAYHGGLADFRSTVAPLNLPLDWRVGEYNDVEGTRRRIVAEAASLGAVLVEPMQGGGCIPATAQFLGMLRDTCTACGIVLIFDEVMTSRLAPGGLQERLGIVPDMTTLGKYLGGGASFGAFGGRRDLMEPFDTTRENSLPLAGTFNNNVISMAAGLAGLEEVFTAAEALRLNALGERLRTRLNEVAAARGAPLRATGIGSLIGLHAAGVEPALPPEKQGHGTQNEEMRKTRHALADLFHLDMLDRGFYFARRGYVALSLPTTDADCDAFVDAVEAFLIAREPLLAALHPAALRPAAGRPAAGRP